MKKFLAILMSLALTVSALACGGTTLFADGSRTDVEAVFDSETGETGVYKLNNDWTLAAYTLGIHRSRRQRMGKRHLLRSKR